MKLESLNIALDRPYGDPGENNPYVATLKVSYDKTSMKVKLDDSTCKRILSLAADEIATAAQVQINDFVKTALTVSETPMIEGALA